VRGRQVHELLAPVAEPDAADAPDAEREDRLGDLVARAEPVPERIRSIRYGEETTASQASGTAASTAASRYPIRAPATKSSAKVEKPMITAEPKSGWPRHAAMNRPATTTCGKKPTVKVFTFSAFLASEYDRYSTMPTFATSDGWMPIGPIRIHRAAPPTRVPMPVADRTSPMPARTRTGYVTRWSVR
jgi:hypothetical protein